VEFWRWVVDALRRCIAVMARFKSKPVMFRRLAAGGREPGERARPRAAAPAANLLDNFDDWPDVQLTQLWFEKAMTQ
jgi:hypothetical protein